MSLPTRSPRSAATGSTAPSVARPDVETTGPDTADREAALMIAHRLVDRQVVEAAVRVSERTAINPFAWGGSGLYSGPASTALLLRRCARVDLERTAWWSELAHQHVVEAVAATHHEPVHDLGLGAGLAGVAVLLADAADHDGRYRQALRTTTQQLAEHVVSADWQRPESGVGDHLYDLVTGWSGAAVGLTAAASVLTDFYSEDLLPDDLLPRAVLRLVADLGWLCTSGPDGVPQHLSPANYPTAEYHEAYPNGYVNLGLAHGIPGALVALSRLGQLAGGDGARHIVGPLADWMVQQAVLDEFGPDWPMGVPVDASGRLLDTVQRPSRPAWCYGAPGVASALATAAGYLGDPALETLAAQATQAVLHRLDGRHPPSPTLCHGTAGLVSALLPVAWTAGDASVRAAGDQVLQALHDQLDPTAPLGVRDVEQPGVELDSPGLLSGAAGVALSLLDAHALRCTPGGRLGLWRAGLAL